MTTTAPASPGPPSPAARARSRHRRAALICSLAGVAALIAIISVGLAAVPRGPTPPVPGATQVYFADYKAGDCLLGDTPLSSDTPWPDLMWRVPCGDSHTYEVFYANFAYWPDSRAYPGLAAVENAGTAECDAQFARYDGVQQPASLFTYTDVLPYPQDTWDNGARQLVCVAFEPAPGQPDGVAMLGSIKGSRR